MAKTTFATGNNLTRKVWEEKLFRDSRKDAYFSRFMGSGSDSMVQVKDDLTKEQGDKITIGIRMRLQGTGVTSGTVLENNEEALTTYDFSVSLEQYRHAVRDRGALDRQRAVFSLDEEAHLALKDWGSEKMDQLCADALGVGSGATADPTKIFYLNSSGVISATGTASTAKSGLDATNSKITPALISALKAWAKTGGGRAYTPLRPVKVEGKEYYVLLVHPDCMYDLKVNSTFQQAQRDAQERGKDNPLFMGATAIWDGVVIHETEFCYTAADGGGGSVAWAKCAFMGAQALVWANGRRGHLIEKEFDYDNEHGVAFELIARAGKPQFNSLDYGSVGLYLARTNIAGL